MYSDDSGAAALLAADVLVLDAENRVLAQRLRIAEEMLSEALDIANQAIAYVATKVAAQ